MSLEPEFWDGLKEIAVGHGVTVSALVTGINSERQHANLTSVVRVFVLQHYQASEKKEPQS
jgi:predicted DNA-binding ribbon-helix-helix protein